MRGRLQRLRKPVKTNLMSPYSQVSQQSKKKRWKKDTREYRTHMASSEFSLLPSSAKTTLSISQTRLEQRCLLSKAKLPMGWEFCGAGRGGASLQTLTVLILRQNALNEPKTQIYWPWMELDTPFFVSSKSFLSKFIRFPNYEQKKLI
jgi:hypothetical protein